MSPSRKTMWQYDGSASNVVITSLPGCEGDVTALRQVWCHLIGNALKLSSKRSAPRIVISGRIEADEAIYLVEDNGAGFDMQYAHRLFAVFQRLHKTEEFPGAGVGLAIAQRLLARHGGRIGVQATVDGGAKFQFALPLNG